MELSDRTLLQVLLRAGDVVALRQVLDDLLTQPTSKEGPNLGVGEPPLEVGDDAIVSRLLGKVIRVLLVDEGISAS